MLDFTYERLISEMTVARGYREGASDSFETLHEKTREGFSNGSTNPDILLGEYFQLKQAFDLVIASNRSYEAAIDKLLDRVREKIDEMDGAGGFTMVCDADALMKAVKR